MNIKCVVACINANGEPDLFPVIVECNQEQYDNGAHYDAAEDKAAGHGYEPLMVIDENDSGFRFFLHTPRWDGTINWSGEIAKAKA